MLTKQNLSTCRTSKDLTKLLKAEGYNIRSHGGSHFVASASNKPSVAIPTGKDLAPGTKRTITKILLGNNYYSK